MELKERFESFNDDFLEFEKVQNKRSKRPDLHAFLLLDEIVPPQPTRGRPDRLDQSHDMIAAAEHDEIWLATSCNELNKNATDEQILELVRCGVRYDDAYQSLCMFV